MPDELRELLRELDTAGRRAGGLLAAAGSLPSGTTDQVRLTILGILLRAVGLPEQYPQARFCLWLHSQGYFDKVKASVEAAGKAFDRELNNLYVSGPIAKALLACDPDFASSEAEARQTLRAAFRRWRATSRPRSSSPPSKRHSSSTAAMDARPARCSSSTRCSSTSATPTTARCS